MRPITHSYDNVLVNGHSQLATFTKTYKEQVYAFSEFDIHSQLNCEAKKLHRFISAITLSNLCLFESLLIHIYHNKFGTK